MRTKLCRKCNTVKTLDEFIYFDGIYKTPCKACKAQAEKERREKRKAVAGDFTPIDQAVLAALTDEPRTAVKLGLITGYHKEYVKNSLRFLIKKGLAEKINQGMQRLYIKAIPPRHWVAIDHKGLVLACATGKKFKRTMFDFNFYQYLAWVKHGALYLEVENPVEIGASVDSVAFKGVVESARDMSTANLDTTN